jgi:hypothetical protein
MDRKNYESDSFLPVLLSGADPAGILYTNGSIFLRGIHKDEVKQMQNLLESDFWENLTKRHLVPKTRILDRNLVPTSMDFFPLVLESEAISPITYPHEWSFEMVKTAALAFLDLVELADSYGYTIKDAHLYNWVFNSVQPVWVDMGSFISLPPFSNSRPWIESFYANVLTPLNLWNSGMPLLANRAVSCPGRLITIDEAIACNHSYLKGQSVIIRKIRSIFRFFLFANNIPENTILRRRIKYLFLKKLSIQVTQLRNRIKDLNYITPSKWGHYHSQLSHKKNYPIPTDVRFTRLLELIPSYSPSSILELAGNVGLLSQALAKNLPEIPIICTDYDTNAIDSLYKQIQKIPISNLSTAVLDFMVSESNSAEIKPQTRFKSDCVIALAVTHHLLLSQGYGYDRIFETIKSYSNRLVFIEFMPLGLYDGKQAPQLPKRYNKENFEASFLKYFTLLQIEQLDVNRILYVGQKNETNLPT